MKFIGIRTPKPRKYSVKPVFYDPVREAQENRLKELGTSDALPGSELRMRMQLRMNRKKLDERIRKRSRSMSILFTLLLLLLILYYIFVK
jgi:cytochrome c-type biogenesis protein CcmH/NrfG